MFYTVTEMMPGQRHHLFLKSFLSGEPGMKLIQFGAGKIGRSFIGQIFSRAGWEVVFVDVDRRIIEALNRKRGYTVVVKDRSEETLEVTGVRGVYASDIVQVSEELAGADLIATAVGQQALPLLAKPISRGLLKRQKTRPGEPLDIILCENMQNAADFFRDALKNALEEESGGFSGVDINAQVGFVETSIGKMVPIMGEKQKEKDPLLVYAEAYNTLILDRLGFRGPIPDIPQLDPRDNMKAYVDRKLYIHNMGHAVLGYVTHVFRPDYRFVWKAAFDEVILRITREAMWESGRVLIMEYQGEFNEKNIGEYIEDLLRRFGNRALGDTIFRVGRDLYRKLGPEDRLAGAINLCRKHGLIPERICLGLASALFFKGIDEQGHMHPKDLEFHEKEMKRGVRHVLENVCRLRDIKVISLVEGYCHMIPGGKKSLDSLLRL